MNYTTNSNTHGVDINYTEADMPVEVKSKIGIKNCDYFRGNALGGTDPYGNKWGERILFYKLDFSSGDFSLPLEMTENSQTKR